MDEVQQNNLAALHRLAATEVKEESLTSWLLRSFREERFTPLIFHHREEPIDVLTDLFAELSTDDQSVFKAAVVNAASQWRSRPHGSHVIKALAYLALYIGATGVIPVLHSQIKKGSVVDNDLLRPDIDTLAQLISVISGFHSTRELQDILRNLFWTDDIAPELTANLFIGLCESDPTRYPLYLPRLFRTLADFADPEYVPYVLEEFTSTVGWDTLCAHFPELPDDVASQLIQVIRIEHFVSHLEEVSPDTTQQLFVHPLIVAQLAELLPVILTQPEPLAEICGQGVEFHTLHRYYALRFANGAIVEYSRVNPDHVAIYRVLDNWSMRYPLLDLDQIYKQGEVLHQM